MTDKSVKNPNGLRREHNVELIRRMRNGESLTSFDSKASWYPPRPVIKKDPAEIARLYESQAAKPAPAAPASSNVVQLGEPVANGGRGFDEAG